MKRVLVFLLCLTLFSGMTPGFAAVQPAPAGSIFVSTTGSDTAAGTASAPLRTIQRAVALAKPGDVVVVAAGVYGKTYIDGVNGLSSSPITLRGEPGTVVKGFTVRRSSYINLSGFELWESAGSSRHESAGVYIYDSAYLNMDSLHVRWNTGDPAAPATAALGAGAVYMDGTANHHIDIRDSEFENWVILNGDYLTVQNSEFHDGRTEDCLRFSGKHILIDGNVMRDWKKISAGGYVDEAAHTDVVQTFGSRTTETYDVQFSNNYVAPSRAGQIFMGERLYSSTNGIYGAIYDIRFVNNLIVRDGGNIMVNTKYVPADANHVALFIDRITAVNNTVVNVGSTVAGRGFSFEGGSGHVVANNVFSRVAAPYSEEAGVTSYTYRGSNLFYQAAASWTTARVNGPNEFYADPQFMSAVSDFRLKPGSPARDRAAGAHLPATDRLGQARFDDPATTNLGSGVPAFGDLGSIEAQADDQTPPPVSAPATPSPVPTVTVPPVSVPVDTEAPRTSASGVVSEWVARDVTVSLTASDTGSGVKETRYSLGGDAVRSYTAPIVVSTSGSTPLAFSSVDNAGNSEATQTVTVRVDKLAPAVPASAVVTSATPDSLSIAWDEVADEHSGIAGYDVIVNGNPAATVTSASARLTGLQPSTTYSIAVRARDLVGNVTAAGPSIVATTPAPQPADVTAPTTYLSGVPSGWVRGTVNVSLSATDDGVGVAETRYSIGDGSFETYTGPVTIGRSGVTSLNYYSIDAAGNTEPSRTAVVRLDNVAPTAPSSVRATSQTSRTASVSWAAASDVHAGVNAYRVYVDGVARATVSGLSAEITSLTPGASHTIVVAASDKVGNVSKSSPVTIMQPLEPTRLVTPAIYAAYRGIAKVSVVTVDGAGAPFAAAPGSVLYRVRAVGGAWSPTKAMPSGATLGEFADTVRLVNGRETEVQVRYAGNATYAGSTVTVKVVPSSWLTSTNLAQYSLR